MPDGQNLASSRRALCYDWLNACPCGESVLSECFYSMYVCMYVEIERLQTEGRRMGMGLLNAIVFSCSTVTIYLTGVAVQCDGLRSPQKKQTAPSSLSANLSCARPSLIGTLATKNWMENHPDRAQIQFLLPDLRGQAGDEGSGGQDAGPCEDAARHSTISASWQTHNKHLRLGRFPG